MSTNKEGRFRVLLYHQVGAAAVVFLGGVNGKNKINHEILIFANANANANPGGNRVAYLYEGFGLHTLAAGREKGRIRSSSLTPELPRKPLSQQEQARLRRHHQFLFGNYALEVYVVRLSHISYYLFSAVDTTVLARLLAMIPPHSDRRRNVGNVAVASEVKPHLARLMQWKN